jgi:RsiW-degrading membrane proteinase PrsW (M82 family)
VILIYLIARDEMDDMMDGFVYGAMVGLGFALIEDVFYFIAIFGGTRVACWPGSTCASFRAASTATSCTRAWRAWGSHTSSRGAGRRRSAGGWRSRSGCSRAAVGGPLPVELALAELLPREP